MAGTAGLFSVPGQRVSGQSIRTQNVMACSALANIVKSSLGPVGLDKMLVDDIADVTVTNDGATILKLLEVHHPAAKVLVDLAQLQDAEVGDGTTSVVILAAELLKLADQLVQDKVHPTSIISGYRLALKEALKFMNSHMVITLGEMTTTFGMSEKDIVKAVAATSLASKVIDGEFFSNLVAEAVLAVKQQSVNQPKVEPKGDEGDKKAEEPKKEIFPIKNIKILKGIGKAVTDSFLVKDGYALNCSLSHQGMPKEVKGGLKVAFLDFSLQKVKMKLGVQVLVADPGSQLEPIRDQEVSIAKQRAARLVKAGCKVLLTTGGIDDLCSKVLSQAGIMGVRRVLKADLKRICKASGGSILTSASALDSGSDLEGVEVEEAGVVKYLASAFGSCESCSVERVGGDDEVIIISGLKKSPSASIVLRGPNEYFLDEIERSVHDALCTTKRVLESKSLVPGAGAVEAALSIYLESYATSISTREQLAIAEFANALLVIPKTLAINGSLDSVELVSALRSFHYAAQNSEKDKNLKFVGLDLTPGSTGKGFKDVVKAGILEPAISKIKSLKFAVEAAITILRIDDLIKLQPQEKGRGGDQCGDDY